MNAVRRVLSVSVVPAVAVCVGAWLARDSRAQAPDRSAVSGAWSLNRDLSDQPSPTSRGGYGDDGASRGTDGRSGRGRRGTGGGGGFRGGFGGGGMNGGRGPAPNPEEMARMRDAIRDITDPPDHMTIVQTGSMVIFTGPDGRTTRLSPDGQKVKDENTKIERKTRWEGAKLVSEINAASAGKITQSVEVDSDRRLRITTRIEGGRDSKDPRTTVRVYDSDALTK